MFRTHNFESIELLGRDESELLDFGGMIQSSGNSLVVRLSGHKKLASGVSSWFLFLQM